MLNSPTSNRATPSTIAAADEENTQREKRAMTSKLRDRAKRHMMRKQFITAVGVCNEALQHSPDNYKVLRIRSVALCSLGRYQEGLVDAERVLKAVTYSGDAWYQKGYAHFHMKQYSAAAHAFAAGLELNGSDKGLQQAFWDSVSLMSQTKQAGEAESSLPLGVDTSETQPDPTLMRFPAASAGIEKA